jgi:COP9 signalosome complex subunit 6
MNSFELHYHKKEGKTSIDMVYYKMKEEQFKQVLCEMDLLGWYSTGESPEDEDVHVHKQILEVHESPLFIQMNPAAKSLNDLPISMYESSIDIVNGEMGRQETRMVFMKIKYDLTTEDSERIGLDHVAKISTANETSQSKVSENLMVQHSAIKMLTSRIDIILEYVQGVNKGELKFDHEILRETKALADRLPILESRDRFTPEFYTQCNDVALMTLMGSVHKSSNDLVQFVNKFNVAHAKQGGGRRMRGMGYY